MNLRTELTTAITQNHLYARVTDFFRVLSVICIPSYLGGILLNVIVANHFYLDFASNNKQTHDVKFSNYIVFLCKQIML